MSNDRSRYYPDHDDVAQNKTMAGLAYLIFFLPLIVCPGSDFGRYHANQGLLLFIVIGLTNAVLSFIPFFGRFLLIPAVNLGFFIVAVIWMLHTFNGGTNELPLVGHIRLIWRD